MDAKTYVQELDRMCETFRGKGGPTPCGDCPLWKKEKGCDRFFASNAVLSWSIRNPAVMTNAKKFEVVFGFFPVGDLMGRIFTVFLVDWWLGPYKEPEEPSDDR